MTVTLLNRFSRFEGVIGLLYGGILFLYSVVALEGKRTDFLIIMGVMFAITVILNMFYRILDKYRKEKLEREYLDEEQHLQAEQLNELYKIGRQANHMKHDMKMKLDTISRILEKGEYKEAELCIKRLGSEWENCLEVPTDTGNEGLNAALMKAMQRCKEKNISFHYVVFGQPVEIESMDMGSLIDNLLMNGIEACEDIGGKREVGIVIRKENGVVEIEAENTIKQSVFSTNPEMVSTKKDSHRHGFGLDTIRKIVEIYDGQYSFWEDQGEDSLWFVQNIYLNIPKTV